MLIGQDKVPGLSLVRNTNTAIRGEGGRFVKNSEAQRRAGAQPTIGKTSLEIQSSNQLPIRNRDFIREDVIRTADRRNLLDRAASILGDAIEFARDFGLLE